MKCGQAIRSHYPTLNVHDEQRPLVYLDSAAMALKPQAVMDAVMDVMIHKTANIHRSVHRLGDLATEAFERSREVVAEFINALAHEIVFVRNTTEALNLVARAMPIGNRRTVVSLTEHHSNLLPWHASVTRLPPTANGLLDIDALTGQLQQGDVGLVSVSHVSNVTGAANDAKQLAALCHQHGALLVVDAAQSVPHEPLDVMDLDCDFLAFSGHKLGSPTGVGVLYGKAEHLDRIAWHLEGGGTIDSISGGNVTPKDTPWRLEAGTPAVEAVVGLSAAIEFLSAIGMQNVHEHQQQLCAHARSAVASLLPEMHVLGSSHSSGPLGLVQRKVSPHVLARSLSDRYNVCVRSGFHCAQPLHEHLGIPASLRLSFYLYNTTDEIDFTIQSLRTIIS